jgi:hypothetical protein
MASSAATGSRGPNKNQSSGRGPPPKSICSIHSINKGHWSYECRTLLRKKQIEEEKRQSVVGTSYVVTRFAMAPESLLVYYTIIDRSARHEYCCSFHLGVFQGIDFHEERELL